jgi:hypothetical protein
MAGNSGGAASNRGFESRTMDYFDRLPRSVREAVANARFDWRLHGWLARFERGEIKARDLVKRVHDVDHTEAAKTRRRTWGTDYPVLKGELPTPRAEGRRSRRR